MKKTTAIVSILSLSTVFAMTTFNALAQDNNLLNINSTQGLRVENSKSEHGDKKEADGKNNDTKDEQDDQDDENDNQNQDNETEISLHRHMSNLVDVSLPIVSSTTIKTYDDARNILTQYQDIIKNITASGTLSNTSSTLSAQEQAVLGKLMHKHSDDFDHLSARANDLSLEIKGLLDLLTPLGTTTISSSFNLKNLIISQLKDFAIAIGDLKILGDTGVEIISQETK